MLPPATATNLEPSAEDATAVQFVAGALVGTQVMPESVEMKISEFLMATNLAPSAEEATADHPAGTLLVTFQLLQSLPEFVEV